MKIERATFMALYQYTRCQHCLLPCNSCHYEYQLIGDIIFVYMPVIGYCNGLQTLTPPKLMATAGFIIIHHHHHHRFKSFVFMLHTSRTVPPIECFYSYECCNSIGVLKQFALPFLMSNQAHLSAAVNLDVFIGYPRKRWLGVR